MIDVGPIEKEIPIPRVHPGRREGDLGTVYHFDNMEVGDSFAAIVAPHRAIQVQQLFLTVARNYGAKHGTKYTTRIGFADDGRRLSVRMWRTR